MPNTESLTYADVKRTLRGEVDLLIDAVAHILVDLGSKEEWSGDFIADTAANVAMLAQKAGLPPATDQDPEALAAWRRIADFVGIEHDGEDDEDEDDDEDDGTCGASFMGGAVCSRSRYHDGPCV